MKTKFEEFSGYDKNEADLAEEFEDAGLDPDEEFNNYFDKFLN